MQRPWCVARYVTGAIAAAALVAAQSVAQNRPVRRSSPDTARSTYRERLLGVFDAVSGAPVESAEVVDMRTGSVALTTHAGVVSLGFLREGGNLVRIRKIGYAMQTLAIAISPVDTAPVTVVLQPVVRLPGVVTYGRARSYLSPHLRAFQARRRVHAAGYFVGEDQLRQDDGRTLANVLKSHVPGINIYPSRGRMLLEPSVRCQNGGPPDVFVDGVPYPHQLVSDAMSRPSRQPGQGADSLAMRRADTTTHVMPIDLADFEVWDLAGIEYYPDGLLMPMQFRHTPGACGALLLWTRER
ncbi:MAG TPA: hypothetical protein VFW98_09405 [Gemmatimonadaceae bacterium]|nr:hypothetical protein [Gemmatimonadaceae bacterium]